MAAEEVVAFERGEDVDDCAFGHDFEHITTMQGELIQVVCAGCGRSWNVEPNLTTTTDVVEGWDAELGEWR